MKLQDGRSRADVVNWFFDIYIAEFSTVRV